MIAWVPGQLTNFLAINYGEEYLAKMRTDTMPFKQAPNVIQQLREELATVIEKVLGAGPEFKEGLAIGNYPKMKMNWHSDGEKGLAPRLLRPLIGCLVPGISVSHPAELPRGSLQASGYRIFYPHVYGRHNFPLTTGNAEATSDAQITFEVKTSGDRNHTITMAETTSVNDLDLKTNRCTVRVPSCFRFLAHREQCGTAKCIRVALAMAHPDPELYSHW
ncbi:ubiquitin-like protein DskB [Apiospora sp. TS-2023a]